MNYSYNSAHVSNKRAPKFWQRVMLLFVFLPADVFSVSFLTKLSWLLFFSLEFSIATSYAYYPTLVAFFLALQDDEHYVVKDTITFRELS